MKQQQLRDIFFCFIDSAIKVTFKQLNVIQQNIVKIKSIELITAFSSQPTNLPIQLKIAILRQINLYLQRFDNCGMRSMVMPLEQELDSIKQTKFCINQSREVIENQKKQEFLNKLTFRYSLTKINKEKMYGRLIPMTAGLYPRLSYEAGRYTAHQYSAPRIRQNRRSYILYKQQPSPEHHQNIKRYTQLLNKQKQKQGGLDSFWMFKKDVQSQEKKKRDKKSAAEERKMVEESANRVEQAFSRVFIWGKLPVDLQTGLINKNLLKNYLGSILGDCFAQWFISFFQIRSYINFKQFRSLGQKFSVMILRQSLLLSFMLYDHNGDGFICPRDIFSIFSKQLDPAIEEDVLKIGKWVKSNEGKEEEINQQFKIQHVVIQDQSLTFKDYEVFFKKADEPFLRATNKKDTGFAKTFAVLEHREKVRSTRRELNHKKNMYNQLFGQIARQNRNNAYVDLNDYKLNYTFLQQIFPDKSTKLFDFFCSKIFGVSYNQP